MFKTLLQRVLVQCVAFAAILLLLRASHATDLATEGAALVRQPARAIEIWEDPGDITNDDNDGTLVGGARANDTLDLSGAPSPATAQIPRGTLDNTRPANETPRRGRSTIAGGSRLFWGAFSAANSVTNSPTIDNTVRVINSEGALGAGTLSNSYLAFTQHSAAAGTVFPVPYNEQTGSYAYTLFSSSSSTPQSIDITNGQFKVGISHKQSIPVSTETISFRFLIQTTGGKWYRSSPQSAVNINILGGGPFGGANSNGLTAAAREALFTAYPVSGMTWQRVSQAAEANMNVLNNGGEVPLGATQTDPGPNLGAVTGMGILASELATGVTVGNLPNSIAVLGMILDGNSNVAVEDFTQGGGNAHGWIGGALPNFGGSVNVNASGLCMSVPGPGSNGVVWVSPERYIELVTSTIYRVRLTLSTTQHAPDSIPLFLLTYDNFNTGGAGNNMGGIAWILDVDGGAEGIGRTQGRTTYDFYFAPNAITTPQWMSGAFTPAADPINDLRLSFQVIDSNETLLTSQDSGTVCVSRLEVTAIPRGGIGLSSTVFNPPISSSTHFAQARDEAGIGGTATINASAAAARYQLTTQGSAKKTLGPYNPNAGANLNLQLYPVLWEANSLCRERASIRAESAETNPVDAIILAMDTATVELGIEQYTTRGAPGSPMDRAASPKLTAAEYETYFFSQNATASLVPNANRLRPLAIFSNTTELFGDGTGGDAFIVESLAVDKLVTPQ